ncbi:MAG: hypothetical protein LBM93_05920 [Oscillospiraceae bacterium]|jgi:hypothetical protein|nr:hypothetical protein [Oscillospiraceae bacterium]
MVGKNSESIIKFKLTAETNSPNSILDLFVNSDKNTSIEICDGNANLELLNTNNSGSFDGTYVIELLVSFPFDVAAGVLANFIFKKICSGAKKIEINNHRTRMTEEGIIQSIEKNVHTIEIEDPGSSNKYI